MILDELQLNIISNFLANHHDWPTENVCEDFKSYIDENEIPMNNSDSNLLITSFLQIDSKSRFSNKFDHFQFVRLFTMDLIDQNIS